MPDAPSCLNQSPPPNSTLNSTPHPHTDTPLQGGGLEVHSDDLRLATLPWPRTVQETSFEKLLKIMKLQAVFVTPDGHCLFSAVALTLFGTADLQAAMEVRRRLLAWTIANFDSGIQRRLPLKSSLKTLIAQLDCRSLTAPPTQWGNVDTLCLIAQALNVSFIVLKLAAESETRHVLVGTRQCSTRHVLVFDHHNQHYYATTAVVVSRRQCVFFFAPGNESGFLSNHFCHGFSFLHSGVEVQARSGEHMMMYLKALLFGDQETAAQIERAQSPQQAKELARQIPSFVQCTWDAHKHGVMMQVLRGKFPLRSPLADRLMSTMPMLLVEASPTDAIWGM